VDISYEIPQLVADQKVRSARTRYHPGGNGINVARALARLGVPLRCCSIVGGESGNLLLRLLGDRLGEGHHYVTVEGETRVNVTLLQKHPPSQYEVDSGGPEVPPEVLEEVTGCFLTTARDGLAVLTGSTPPGVPEDTYARLAEQIRAQGGRVVVDAHGRPLQHVLQARPYLVRLNRYVLEMTIKRRLESVETVAAAGREIQAKGVDLVCISLGKEGAILVDAGDSYHCAAPKVRVHSTVGSGDSMVAGMVAAAHQGHGVEEMLRFGVICGSATASHPGTALFTREEVEEASYDLQLASLGI
jgi:6-phosphofructokinase 2